MTVKEIKTIISESITDITDALTDDEIEDIATVVTDRLEEEGLDIDDDDDEASTDSEEE